MIEATFRQWDGGLHELHMRGHATGDETVCAGASGIAYALLGTLENLGSHVSYYEHEMESGNLWVCAGGDERVKTVFFMAQIGFMQIEKSHPELIKVCAQGATHG